MTIKIYQRFPTTMVEDARFWERTRWRLDGCIIWTGRLSPYGYGRLRRKGVSWQAHRYVYTKAYGPIPEGKIVRHKCDRRSCVNPEHLVLGTQQQNVADMMDRGRQAVNERVARTKLSVKDVQTLRRRAAKGESRSALAREYKLNRRTVLRIISGERRTYA